MHEPKPFRWRFYLVLILLTVGFLAILWRLVDLNLLQRHFLRRQSQARILRKLNIPATRGMITDRLGSPLAISTPVSSVWINPRVFKANGKQLLQLSEILDVKVSAIERHVKKSHGRGFVYLKRMITPLMAAQLRVLHLEGLYFQREYKRYYPEGEVAAHVVGLTNIDDQGQEGVELEFNKWLRGVPGQKEVLIDRLGQVIANVALLKKPVQGKTLPLSIDHRIQYLAYRSLKAAVQKYHAQAGSVVVMDVKTGEVLAMVNQPSYNPNVRPKDSHGRYRNRAVTDIYEPGSVMKPFTIALALLSGEYQPDSIVNTSPGWMTVGGYKITDDGLNRGKLTLTQILQKSSNVGAAKVLLSLKPQQFYDLLRRFGFGLRTHSGFPGEANGTLEARSIWYPSVVAALAYGYGIAVTTLQLAHAYQIIANQGISLPVSLVQLKKIPSGRRIVSRHVALEILRMLQTVVEPGGTGLKAAVRGYHVAGKTGTAYIAGPEGYNKHRYVASFVGIAPASRPRLVVAVDIRDPKGQHFGGIVAAPVFSQVMAGALRILNIPPDNLPGK